MRFRPRPTPSPRRGLLSVLRCYTLQTLTVTLLLSSTHTRALQRLIIGQSGQDAEDHRRTGIQLDAHQAVRNSVADVLKVHSRALDEASDGDDSVERPCGSTRSLGLWRGGGCGSRRVDEGEEVGS